MTPFRNRTAFERNILTRRYGFNNATSNATTQQNGGFSATSTSSTQVAKNPSAWSNWPRGRGGRGKRKIICAKLYELKMLSKKIFQADQKFGKILAQQNPEVYDGYIAWAKTVVAWMDGKGPQCMFWIKDAKKRNKKQKELSRKWAKAIATPWAKHMAYLMGVEKKDNKAGKIIMALGKPICKVVGRWRTIFGESRKEAGLLQGYSLWLLFAVFRLITLIFDKK